MTRRRGFTTCAVRRKAGEEGWPADGRSGQKFASAHDLRWSFGTRWAKRVMPALLRRLMRHAEIAATMKYYVTMDADSVADELWARDWETDNSLRAGNTLGNNCPTTPRNAERPPTRQRRNPLTAITLCQRRARGSNLQPLSGHHISSVAANHSLTLHRTLQVVSPA